MSDNFVNHNYEKRNRRTAHPQSLRGKVVFLIGNDTSVMQNLVTQLAQKGADIALVCWQMPLETIRKIKESVQEAGRHFLWIEQSDTTQKPFALVQLVETITMELGHLDIFIDLSAQKSEPTALTNGTVHLSTPTTPRQPNWLLAQAVLEEMAR
jgi:enoyl-[acyl-carrier-protein] reductase (NADH)